MEFTSIGAAKRQTGLSYLGNINSSAKLAKNKKVSGQYTYIIYLAPARESGYNVCAFSTPECRMGCLNTSGRAGMELIAGKNKIKMARITKTRLFFEHQEFYMRWMFAEIRAAQNKAKKDGMGFSVRLNGTSDIDYSKVLVDGKNVFETFKNVQFYDYTKSYDKINNNTIPNYQLTYSYTGRNIEKSIDLLDKGNNVAVVFNVKAKQQLPQSYMGYEVVDGDITDFRVDDGRGQIIGLRFKEIGNKKVSNEIKQSVFVVNTDAVM